MGLGAIQDFRHPLGILDSIPGDKGGGYHTQLKQSCFDLDLGFPYESLICSEMGLLEGDWIMGVLSSGLTHW